MYTRSKISWHTAFVNKKSIISHSNYIVWYPIVHGTKNGQIKIRFIVDLQS